MGEDAIVPVRGVCSLLFIPLLAMRACEVTTADMAPDVRAGECGGIWHSLGCLRGGLKRVTCERPPKGHPVPRRVAERPYYISFRIGCVGASSFARVATSGLRITVKIVPFGNTGRTVEATLIHELSKWTHT